MSVHLMTTILVSVVIRSLTYESDRQKPFYEGDVAFTLANTIMRKALEEVILQ